MSIYYNYSPDGPKLVVLSYIYDCVYLYIYEELVKWFVDKLGKILRVKFLGYAHLFMSISILKLKDQYISFCHARYASYIVEKKIYTSTIK